MEENRISCLKGDDVIADEQVTPLARLQKMLEAKDQLSAARVIAMSGNVIAGTVSIDPYFSPVPVKGVEPGNSGDDVDEFVREGQPVQCLARVGEFLLDPLRVPCGTNVYLSAGERSVFQLPRGGDSRIDESGKDGIPRPRILGHQARLLLGVDSNHWIPLVRSFVRERAAAVDLRGSLVSVAVASGECSCRWNCIRAERPANRNPINAG
jgi:hypothetical protein